MKRIIPIIIIIATTQVAAAADGSWHVRKMPLPEPGDSAVISTFDPPAITNAGPIIEIPEALAESSSTDTISTQKPAEIRQDSPLAIVGKAEITDPEIIAAFIRLNNKDFATEIAEAYLRVGDRYGIRGDIAICQAIIETGWFRFADGTAVTLDQNNYCGLGVTTRGIKGCSFDTIDDGTAAHIQHLYAYACRAPLPAGERLLDPRFRLVSRGIAPNWTDLSNRWAMNPNYGNQIIRLFNQLQTFATSR